MSVKCLVAYGTMKNKVVLITGASSGIGAGCAEHFAKLGCRLVITGRNARKLEETKQKCVPLTSDNNVVCVIGDVTKASDCETIVNATIQSFGGLDVLVNSAGILVNGTLANTSEADYDKQMDANVRSAFLMMKAAIPHLIQSKGSVVNVSSVCGIRSFPGICVYNMSKAALDQMTTTTALELAPHGVRVNSINPGVIVTEIHRRSGMNEDQYQKYLEHSQTTHALGRVGTVDETANAIVFLASPAASFITGALLPVDGGRGVMCPR